MSNVFLWNCQSPCPLFLCSGTASFLSLTPLNLYQHCLMTGIGYRDNHAQWLKNDIPCFSFQRMYMGFHDSQDSQCENQMYSKRSIVGCYRNPKSATTSATVPKERRPYQTLDYVGSKLRLIFIIQKSYGFCLRHTETELKWDLIVSKISMKLWYKTHCSGNADLKWRKALFWINDGTKE